MPIPLAEGSTLWLASLCDGTLRPYSLALGRLVGRSIRIATGATTAAVQVRHGVVATANGAAGRLSLIRLQQRDVRALGQANSPVVGLSGTQHALIAISQLGSIKRVRAD
jgi:hypothetical protein